MNLFYLLIFLSFGLYVHCNVITLADSNFDSVLTEHDFALINFFTPGCAKCETLGPEFRKAALVLENDNPAVFLAEIDCSRNGKVTCENYAINSYPLMKFFRHGKKAFNYEGTQDSASGIIKHVRSLVRPLSIELLSTEDVEKFRDNPEHSIIGFFEQKDSVIYERYELFASTVNDRYRFGHTFNIDVRNTYGANNTFFIYRSLRLKTTFEPDEIEYHGVYSPYKMRDWLLTNIHGLVGHRTPDNAIDFINPLIILYYDVDYVKNAKASNYWRNRAMKVAKKFSDAQQRVTFAVSNSVSFEQELTELGLESGNHGDKPIVVGRNEGGQTFVMEYEFTTENLDKFVNKLLMGTQIPSRKYNSAPSTAGDSIMQETADSDQKPTVSHSQQKTEL